MRDLGELVEGIDPGNNIFFFEKSGVLKEDMTLKVECVPDGSDIFIYIRGVRFRLQVQGASIAVEEIRSGQNRKINSSRPRRLDDRDVFCATHGFRVPVVDGGYESLPINVTWSEQWMHFQWCHEVSDWACFSMLPRGDAIHANFKSGRNEDSAHGRGDTYLATPQDVFNVLIGDGETPKCSLKERPDYLSLVSA